MATVEVKVPDIGDFKDVPVIEVLVKPGDAVNPEDPLVTLESDKATMDVPSPAEGTVKALSVKIGDKVSEGSALLMLESGAPSPEPSAPTARRTTPPSPQPPPATGRGSKESPPRPPAAEAPGVSAARTARSFTGRTDRVCERLVLGSGPGGYSAAFRSADLGMKTVLVERYATLGGVCLNVGCIPSKALLHTAAVMDEVKTMGAHGIRYGTPQIDLDELRGFKEGVVKKLTGGLAGMAKARKVEVVRGVGRFLDPYHLEVELTTGNGQDKNGEKKTIRFQKAIIAAGSQAVKLP